MDLEKALHDLFSQRRCTPSKEEECKRRNGPSWAQLCRLCGEKQSKPPHPYVCRLLDVTLLMDAGLVFDEDLFEMQTWLEIGVVRRVLQRSASSLF